MKPSKYRNQPVEVVGYQGKRIKDSPGGTFHVCQVAGDFEKGRIICIYAQGRNF